MPLAKATMTKPEVSAPAAVTNVGDSAVVEQTRAERTILGQIRTHLVAHAMPSLLSTIDLTDAAKVKALMNEYTRYVQTGE